ncbi:xylan 1,4-beta-xylosidase [Streptomyces cinnamoneus]|uniref:Xylan 1,4-beta-xylosidase n=1 Tax=Streptomyces cinnamoneus TaxID=53446 RepID=A0A2G1XB31_STRCJ|nr:xylan 1,4-beta-xylosidase [Streptomyces cinnamoneus]PHQ48457.1 xylan 1,4-beta-xylosidase [Streptomyces cinnamoneus]PPT12548.1 xylan 1,4-beta-xylosidase [Streptomyces cinnamoneus]
MGRHRGGRALLQAGGGRPRAGRWRLPALLAGTGLVLGLVLALVVLAWQSGVGGTGPPGRAGGTAADLGWGFTHTQYSADLGQDGARKAAVTALSADPLPQNQHIMGWGADNPEPRPGAYNFSDLDRRVALMRRSGGAPVLTLCCAPDWMKGGGTRTDWSQKSLEKAPERAHYRDFAKLAGVIAARYPDVRHFIVWNEFKGFYDESRNRWDYEGYTELYNLVYKEVKKRNRHALVGGPYVVMDSEAPGSETNASRLQGDWGVVDQRAIDALEYWDEHKEGADFVVVDGSSYTRTGSRTLPDEFAATAKFADVTTWLNRTTGLPVWWAEWYVEPADAHDERKLWTEPHRVAVQAVAMMRLAESGAAAAFYWNPEEQGPDCPGCLWRSTELGDGGGGLPMLGLLSRFAKEFPPGADFRPVDVEGADGARLRTLAAGDALLVVNTSDRGVTARVDGRTVDLGAYEARWL